MIRFLAEVSRKSERDIYAIPSTRHSKEYNIYELDISEPPFKSYWTAWGGWYDEYVGTNIELYYEQYLKRVYNLNDLYTNVYSFILVVKELEVIDGGDSDNEDYDGGNSISISNDTIDANDIQNNYTIDVLHSEEFELYDGGNAFTIRVEFIFDGGNVNSIDQNRKIVLFNVPKHTWLYSNQSVEAKDLLIFLSSSLNPDNPSNNYIRNANAPIRLETPNFSIKLSDTIAGISLNQGFNISLHNNDGYFDDDKAWNIFNTPIYLKKSIIENPVYEDFKTIRTGFVESTSTNFDSFEIDVSDNFKSLEEPVCNVIEQDDYDISIDESNLYKNIPIVYGTKKVKLAKLDNTHYVAAEYVTSIIGVYNSNDAYIPYTYDSNTNIITATNADNALITGYTNNRVGEIILDLITKKTNILFNDTYYNIMEINNYANTSPRINIALENGNVKKAIQTVLKSDLAFFIQQIDGRFTIRKYGTDYNTHSIPSWAVTKKLEKNYNTAQENYFSSCTINYNYIDDKQFSTYLNSDNEGEAENLYQKKVLKSFDTELIDINDVKNLSNLLSERYTKLKQTLKVAIGIDTINFELLDTVVLDTTINGRKFSNGTKYIIKEINPSQDILVLEEI